MWSQVHFYWLWSKSSPVCTVHFLFLHSPPLYSAVKSTEENVLLGMESMWLMPLPLMKQCWWLAPSVPWRQGESSLDQSDLDSIFFIHSWLGMSQRFRPNFGCWGVQTKARTLADSASYLEGAENDIHIDAMFLPLLYKTASNSHWLLRNLWMLAPERSLETKKYPSL